MIALPASTQREPLAHCFGAEHRYAVGVEEELLLVDPERGLLAPVADREVGAAHPQLGRLDGEIFASEIELVTPICATVSTAAAALRALSGEATRAGARVIGAGLHPATGPDDAQLSDSPRYALVSEALKGLLRTPPAALHLHVGMPDAETAIRVCNGMRRHLPLLHSLGANSPFWFGRDSGLASARTAVLGSYPRYGVPRWFRDWEDFSAVCGELVDAAGVPDYTFFWWDVRPHPQLGTVEVRAPDAQASPERTTALIAFIHSLARLEAELAPSAPSSMPSADPATSRRPPGRRGACGSR